MLLRVRIVAAAVRDTPAAATRSSISARETNTERRPDRRPAILHPSAAAVIDTGKYNTPAVVSDTEHPFDLPSAIAAACHQVPRHRPDP